MNRKKIFCIASILIFMNSINQNMIKAEDVIQNVSKEGTVYSVSELIDLNEFNNEITEKTTTFLSEVNLEEAEKYLNEKISTVDKLYSSYIFLRNEYYLDNSNIESFTKMIQYSQLYYETDRAVKQMILTLSEKEGYGKLKESYNVSGIINMDFAAEQTRIVNEYYSDASNRKIAENYLSLIELRKNEAKATGFNSYSEMAYKRFYNRDYTQKDVNAVSENILEILSSISETSEINYDNIFQLNKLSQEKIDQFGQSLSKMPENIQSLYNKALENSMLVFGTNLDSSFLAKTNYIPELQQPVSYIGHSDIIDELGYFSAMYYKEKRTSVIGMNQTSDDILLSIRNFIKLYYYYNTPEYSYSVNNICFNLREAYIINCFEDYVYSEPELTVDKLNKKFYEIKKSAGEQYSEKQTADMSWLEIEDLFVAPFKSADELYASLRGINYMSLLTSDVDAAKKVLNNLLSENDNKSFYDILSENNLITSIDENSCKIINDKISNIMGSTSDYISLPGDISDDGVVSASDLILLRKYLLLCIPKSDISATNSDVNKDGRIDINDYMRVVQILLNNC